MCVFVCFVDSVYLPPAKFVSKAGEEEEQRNLRRQVPREVRRSEERTLPTAAIRGNELPDVTCDKELYLKFNLYFKLCKKKREKEDGLQTTSPACLLSLSKTVTTSSLK